MTEESNQQPEADLHAIQLYQDAIDAFEDAASCAGLTRTDLPERDRAAPLLICEWILVERRGRGRQKGW